jgi:hypothetical protein
MDPDLFGLPDPDPSPYSECGPRKDKMGLKEEKMKKVRFFKSLMFCLEEGRRLLL